MRELKRDWYKYMFDNFLVERTLNSKSLLELAEREADFLIKILDIKKTEEILDVPCGTGRHSNILASKDYSVTGLDISEACVNLAKKKCKNDKARFEKADMFDLGRYKNQFDVVLNLGTSFGYLPTDEENMSFMRELVSALKPKGRLCISAVNKDCFYKNYYPTKWGETNEIFALQRFNFDPHTNYLKEELVIIDKKSKEMRKYFSRVRYYSKSELVFLMKEAGLKKIKFYGSSDMPRFSKYKTYQPFYLGYK